MNNHPLRPLLPPLVISIISALGLCLIAAYAWFVSRPNAQAIPTETTTPFKYAFLSTETPVVTETPPTEELVMPVIPTSDGIGPATSSTTEVAAGAATPDTTIFAEVTPDSRTCTAATAEYLDAILTAVASLDANNQVTTAWMVESNDVVQLIIVGAKIRQAEGDAASAPLGVWGLMVYDDGGFDIYAINDIAQGYSYAAYGSDFQPPLTMETDGAQFVYDCALAEP